MKFYNPFKKKTEKRSVEVNTPAISLTEQEEQAISLIFGKFKGKENLAMNLSSVFRAVTLIANSVASLPLVLYKTDSAGNKSKYCTHPCYPLLDRKPNKFQHSFDFIKLIVTDMLLKGNGYAIIHRDMTNGKVTSLEYVPSSKVSLTKKEGADGELVELLYNISGRRRMMTSDEILHFRNELDSDGVTGISTLTYAARTMKLATANEDSAANLFESGGRLSGILKVQGAVTSKQKDEMKRAWRESLGGANQNGIAVLTGAQDFQAVTMNAAEQQLLESRKFEVSEIARFFNVSPILLYDLEKNSYTSSESAHLQLLTDTLAPIIFKMELEMENKLLTEAEIQRCDIKFDTVAFLRTDAKSMAENLRTYFNMGVYSINEMRAVLDLNAIEDGDEHYVPAQIVTLGNSLNLGAQVEEPKMDNTLKPTDEEEKPKEKEEEEKEDE